MSVFQHYGAFAKLGNIIFVGYEAYGATLVVEALKKLHYFIGSFGIEVSSCLIGEKDYGVIYKGARNGYPLLLSARELTRQVVQSLF